MQYKLLIPTHVDVTTDVSIDYAEDEIFRRIEAREDSALLHQDCQDFLVSDQGGFVSLSGSAVALFREITMALECALNQLDEEFGVGLPPHRIMDESEVF